MAVPFSLFVVHPGEQIFLAPIRGRLVRGLHEIAHGGAFGDLPHDRCGGAMKKFLVAGCALATSVLPAMVGAKEVSHAILHSKRYCAQ
jgi:hypothetical protein